MYATIKISANGVQKNLCCQLDTEAGRNVIELEQPRAFDVHSTQLAKSKTKLKCFSGQIITPIRTAVLKCEHKGKKYGLRFEMVSCAHIPLLFSTTCLGLGLITVINSIRSDDTTQDSKSANEEFSDVFEGDGTFPGVITTEVDSSIPPPIDQQRRIPVTVHEELSELDRLEKRKIVAKVDQHTEWTSYLVCVKKKNKSLCICLDPFNLNRSVKTPHYQSTTLGDVAASLSEARVFTAVDAKNGFWQLVLDEASGYLTTFLTTNGRYRWLCVPFGISCAPEIFIRKQKEAIHELEGAESIVDDVIIIARGATNKEAIADHHKNLRGMLTRLR